MDFAPTARAEDYCGRMWDFMREEVFPAEPVWDSWLERHGPHSHPDVLEDLKVSARRRGLWNLFHPELSGLTHGEYAAVAEISGWSPVIAPEAINCQSPDSGNMETLMLFATPAQRTRWLDPLLDGRIRSAYAMTEPEVASSDATNIQLTIRQEGGEWVLDGRKWWISGVADERCEVLIVMGRTASDGEVHRQQSMVLVPRDTPGLEVLRDLPILGFHDRHGHVELRFTDVRVPVDNLLGEVGGGFAIAQARLGPGRVHHAMRAIGMAERALALLIDRARTRTAFGGPLIDQGVVQAMIADSRVEIAQARLLVQHCAWLIDQGGPRNAISAVSQIKIAAPAVACRVIDRAIEVFGAAGMSADTPLAYFAAWARALRIVDGPDAVHRRTIARRELKAPPAYLG